MRIRNEPAMLIGGVCAMMSMSFLGSRLAIAAGDLEVTAEKIAITDLALEGCSKEAMINEPWFNRLQGAWRSALVAQGEKAEALRKKIYDNEMTQILRVMRSDSKGGCRYIRMRLDETFESDRPVTLKEDGN